MFTLWLKGLAGGLQLADEQTSMFSSLLPGGTRGKFGGGIVDFGGRERRTGVAELLQESPATAVTYTHLNSGDLGGCLS